MASPVLAPPDVKDVTLSLFGGRKTDMAASDVPEGLTLDEQDGIYLPGQWQSRPGLSRLYAAGALTPGTSVLYEKTYIQPNDQPLTLILTSDGKLWKEDVANALAPVVIPSSITPGLYAQSVTEFGREYMAFSDLLHGQGVPLQFDGTFLDRVTMDGPGSPPLVAEENQVATINSVGGAAMLNDTILPNGLTESGNVVTVVGTGGNFIWARPGDSVQITGASVAAYNGTWTISKIIDGNTLQFIHPTVGLAASGNGSANLQLAAFNLLRNLPATVGQSVTIAGVGVAGYNGTWTIRAVNGGGGQLIAILNVFGLASSNNGTATLGGSISAGTHQCVVMFLTRQGYITAPSPATQWIASGGKRVVLSNIPIGPANTVARVIGFTGAGGDNFFIIPATVTLPNPTGTPPLPIQIAATIVPDNVSTTYTFDFDDNTLFAATAIDQIGNDLFDQVVLGPVLGFFAYASRLVAWGDYNKVENFLNMGFDGGYLLPLATAVPLGWTKVTIGGTLSTGGAWASGLSWKILTDGTNLPNGQLSQPAYQDSFGNAILSPLTLYTLRVWLQSSYTGSGTQLFVAEFFSPTSGSLATAIISLQNQPIFSAGAFAFATLNNRLPSIIPTDTVLRISAASLIVGIKPTIQVDELSIIFAENPYRDNLSRWSYVNNPEAFAETTGELGPADDESPMRCFALLRQSALLETGDGVHIFTDNTGEPDTWNVNQLTRAIGSVSLKGGDPGKFGTGDAAEDWAFVAGKNGVYLFAGAEFWKVSQEISRNPGLSQAQDPRVCWDDINWAAEQTIVAKNDPAARRAYFAAPVNGSVTPNKLFVLDYREMDTATQIASAAPLHITLQGKMRSSDLTRKWSVWNVPANDIEILIRPGNQRALCFGGGPNSNGQAFGNIYTLDPTKLTDDDYGAISPYYTTYFFTDHETEQALGIGSDMHLVKRLHAFIAGVGMVYITPIVDSLYNFLPSLSPRVLTKDTDGSNFLKSDLEWTTVGVRGQRVAFRIFVQPLPGTTDVQLRLQKFVAGMMKDPVVQVRQSAI